MIILFKMYLFKMLESTIPVMNEQHNERNNVAS